MAIVSSVVSEVFIGQLAAYGPGFGNVPPTGDKLSVVRDSAACRVFWRLQREPGQME